MVALPDLRPVEGKYEILRKLGEGGMGIVYLVRHRLLHELRVVKVLRGQLRGHDELRERFVREARTAIHLRHPNVAQLYEFEVDDAGTAYMVLEFIDGQTVEQLVAAGRAGPLRLRLEIAVQALRALAFLHRKGFVHRDISPDNLMLTEGPDGEPLVKLLDLGIVKSLHGDAATMTGTQVFLGKVRYASPEQLESSQVDVRSDLYSFGVLLYELLTGIHPIEGDDARSLMSGHLFREPIPFERSDPAAEIPSELRQVVLSALRKDRGARIGSAVELRHRLEALDCFRAPLGAWEPPPSTVSEFASEPGRPPAATSAQRHLDEQFDVERRTPAAPAAAKSGVPAPPVPEAAADEGAGDDGADAPARSASAADLRRRIGELLSENRFDEANWLVLGEAYDVLSTREAEELARQIRWREGAQRQLRFEVAISCAESSLAEGDLESARRSHAEARTLLPHDPRLRDLERRIEADGG